MTQAKQQKETGAGARYKANITAKKTAVQLVEVYPPSGEMFLFEKPSKFSMLFASGQLPVAAANQAVDAWRGAGIMADDEEGVENQLQLIKTALEMRDKVLKYSHTPKLVVGPAQNDNELSTDDVTDDDLEYLFKWVAAGGDQSRMLGTFPGRPQSDTLASASRPKQRKQAQQVSGDR